MANDERIGCNAGRTTIIDPNIFDGQNSSSNISVPVEDLTISVSLTTFKKGRTILTASEKKDGGGTIDSTNDVKVSFIDGEDYGGERVLTTDYTDLTIDFGNQPQSLGITSIDIDFNSSYAPMIVINFVDVKGNAIFQNENNLKNSTNKYSTFFQLPYPLFELTVKGYYGRPVKYCLHLTKFNSKFNSKTGNFEITCNFVGYTYAMLSDMLIGYLKAIPYTRIGGERYKEINAKRESSGAASIIDLNELMILISNINNEVQKIAATDVDAAQITNIENKQALLNTIKNNVNELLAKPFDIRKDENLSKYDVIIRLKTERKNDESAIINSYITNITENINKYNKIGNGEIKLLETNFIDVTKIPYHFTNCTIDILKANDGQSPITDSDVSTFIVNYIKENKINIGTTDEFDCWYIPHLYKAIEESKLALDKAYLTAKENLGETIKYRIKDYLGFDPTIRNIVEIFTTAIEVFMETMFLVSSSAKEDKDNSRKNQLKNKFTDNKNSDLKDIAVFHPWPDYRENDVIEKSYVEKYLGTPGVLPIPTDVDEVEFIEDLLKAFLIAKAKEDEAENITNSSNKNWFPVNPLDTVPMGVDVTPYRRMEVVNMDEVTKVMLIRGMTFLGYTNSYLSKEEIEAMAENEYNSVLENISDDAEKSVTLALSRLTTKTFLLTKGNVNGEKKEVVVDRGDEIEYRFIMPDAAGSTIAENVVSVLPISEFPEKIDWNVDTADDRKLLSNSVSFLTNYSKNVNTDVYNEDDGGQYIKILTTSDYELGIKELPTTTGKVEPKPLLLEKLKEKIVDPDKLKVGDITAAAIAANFNAFGGEYGIQSFNEIDYTGDESGVGVAPLKYVFYKDKIETITYSNDNKMTHLSLPRIDKSKKAKTGEDNEFETINEKEIRIDEQNTFENIYGNIFSKTFPNHGQNRLLLSENTNNTSIPYININIINNGILTNKSLPYLSLFGSKFFYGQKNNEAKALLFLNTLPFNGVFLENLEIKNLFQIRGGFIKAPRLWCAYIGGLLYRLERFNDIINWFYQGDDGKIQPLLPWKKDINEYVPPEPSESINKLYDNSTKYDELPRNLTSMPEQARNEFIRIFEEFCQSSEWKIIYNNSIIVNDGDFNAFNNSISYIYNILNIKTNLTLKNLKDAGFININNYYIMTPVEGGGSIDKPRTMFLENFTTNDNSKNKLVSNNIVSLLKEEVVIANNYPYFWTDFNESIYKNDIKFRPIVVSENDFNIYFNKISELFNKKGNSLTPVDIKRSNEQEIFGTSDEDVIKLILYRYCKNIYDKWLGGVNSIDDIIFQCGQDTSNKSIRNNTDFKLADYYRKGDKPRLIDSFRFVDRSFSNIGDKFFINPLPINEFLLNNPNSSFYGSITSLLASNNFDFVSLPSFINFNDPKQVESLFKPYPNFEEAIANGDCGPSFVSVYVGQKSKHLDFNDSNYQNDGIDFQCDENRNLITVIPDDFNSNKEEHEDSVAVFSVNYSQQNQNIFKDITLDQSEFSETDESLRITNDIANKGTENNRTLAGQNIFNVYSVRSYNAQVEMMGNAMIQPMMYFQLNNIPMFHGGYMITRVKHSIIPNSMSTVFTGVRIRFPKTKLLEGADFYMNMLDSMNLGPGTGSLSTSSSVPPIVNTIIENGGVNGKIDAGNIKTGNIKFGKIKGIIDSFKIENTDEGILLEEAIEPLYLMLNDWVKWMIDEEFAGIEGRPGFYAGITSAFRTIERQETTYNNNKKGTAAPVGTSNHGWGIAVDLQFYNKKGEMISQHDTSGSPNNEIGFNFNENESLVWLLKNSFRYGWIIPQGLRDGKGKTDEFWHFEYHGKSAICLLDYLKVVKGKGGSADIIINTTDDPYNKQESIVTNPNLPGTTIKEATYSTCDFVYIKNRGDGIPINTKTNKAMTIKNQTEVKNFLKNQNLTREQTAAIMGNMHHETIFTFDPLKVNSADRNGYPSVGLIQWNGEYTPAGGSKDSSTILETIGSTVDEQLKYLITMPDYKAWLKKVKTENDVDLITFWFANLVERCHLCGSYDKINTQSTYNKSYQYPRSKYAIDFNNRFNDKNDILYWDK